MRNALSQQLFSGNTNNWKFNIFNIDVRLHALKTQDNIESQSIL